MARIVLGVGGGIAAYKAAALCSRLVQRGDEVDVVMTDAATRFVAPLTFAALARRPVWTSAWERPEDIPHIALARGAELVAIVPATANLIAKLASGLADDLLTNVALATRAPLVIAPAMNTAMLEHPATVANLATLRARGVAIVAPGSGFLAERESGPGRLADEGEILAALDAALGRAQSLRGVRVLITAGPTREALDPVRFLSNAATGTMGIEIARAALHRGAQVDLVLGPTHLAGPPGAATVRVTTAAELAAAALARFERADIVVATAAVADFRPVATSHEKVKKTDGPASVELAPTTDVLAAMGERKGARFLIGFAAETHDHERNARDKLERKRLDAIAVNDVTGERGFGPGENALVLLSPAGGRRDLGRAPKGELAVRFWDAIEALRAGGAS